MSNQRVTLDVAKSILEATGSAVAVADSYGVSHQTVRLYKRLVPALARDALAELLAEGRVANLVTDSTSAPKFSKADIAAIRSSAKSSIKMAAEMDCSASMIRMIRTYKTYI